MVRFLCRRTGWFLAFLLVLPAGGIGTQTAAPDSVRIEVLSRKDDRLAATDDTIPILAIVNAVQVSPQKAASKC